MKILSFDVGIKNLAFCLLNVKNGRHTIDKWDVINLCDDDTNKVCCCKKPKKCNQLAKYYDDTLECDNFYCKKHAKLTDKSLPSNSVNPKKLSKMKLSELLSLASDLSLTHQEPARKQQVKELIQNHYDTNFLKPIKETKAEDVDLITIGRRMTKHFDTLFTGIEIDKVIIENQISPIANRMKTIQGMIAQYFIIKKVESIEFISATNKLKDFHYEKHCTEMDLTSYATRKRESVKWTNKFLIENSDLTKFHAFYVNHKKKDDLADSFLQGLWYIKKHITN